MREGEPTAARGLRSLYEARAWPELIALALAAAVLAVGLAGAASMLGRDPWLDEFWTLASTEPSAAPSQFFAVMARDVHPLLHYGLVYVARGLGLADLAALRALNAAGPAFAAWAIWLAWSRAALTRPQLCVLVALYASSAMFIGYFAELRAYFLVHSLSIAVVVIWRVLAREIADARPWGRAELLAWGVSLAVFVNLHYFATLLGGLLTLSLLVQRRDRGGLPFAVVSAFAAAPAVAMAVVQSLNADAEIVAWVQTGRLDAAFVIVDSAWSALATNIVVVGCAAAAALRALERPAEWRALRDEIVLAAVIVGYFAIIMAINAARPIVVERYLIASAGPIVVGAALLAAGTGAPKWGAAAACAFALLAQGRGLYSQSFGQQGWAASATLVAELAAGCPSSEVHIDPTADGPPGGMLATVRRYGLRHYAERYGLTVREVAPGDVIAPVGQCPSVVWLEHFSAPDGMTADGVLQRLRLQADGFAELVPAGRGLVIIVR